MLPHVGFCKPRFCSWILLSMGWPKNDFFHPEGSTGEDQNYFLFHIQAPSWVPGYTVIMSKWVLCELGLLGGYSGGDQWEAYVLETRGYKIPFVYSAYKYSFIILLWTWIFPCRVSRLWNFSRSREFYFFSLKFPMYKYWSFLSGSNISRKFPSFQWFHPNVTVWVGYSCNKMFAFPQLCSVFFVRSGVKRGKKTWGVVQCFFF